MRTVLAEGSDELRRIFREGGRAIASNETAGASAYAPLSLTEALVLDVEGFLNSRGA
jgi:S-adenosylmethionine synthetase